ncbi:MAG: winged helix-turn-helix transcriptional regulator [Firmicutes bacterium]|nr:winged helix-turn-helix transcriptional regulator [Bacillota bacterium]
MINEYLRVFRAFTDENRVRILELLSGGEQCACILLEELKISQPTLSYHMKILCDSGLVKSRRAGKWNYYSINQDGCEYAGRLLQAIGKRKRESMLRIMGHMYRFLRRIGALLEQKAALEKNSACACCSLQNTW